MLFILVALFSLRVDRPVNPLQAVPVLTADNLDLSDRSWKYRSGDDKRWADPHLSDEDWIVVAGPAFYSGPQAASWEGVGWFRLRFGVDSSLVGKSLSIAVYLRGAAEIFLDGRIIASAGRPAASKQNEVSVVRSEPNPKIVIFQFRRSGEHVVAIRHSNFATADFYKIGGLVAGVGVRLSTLDEILDDTGSEIRMMTATQFAFTGIPLAFCLLYGLLYAFHREQRNHLVFALLSLGIAGMTFLDLQLDFIIDPDRYLAVRRLFMAVACLTILTAVHFVHSLFEARSTLHSRILLGVGLVLIPWAFLDPLGVFRAGNVLLLVALVEMIRIAVRALVHKKAGAWVIGAGLVVFVAGIAYDLLLDLELIGGIARITNGYYYGFTGLTVAMATYLSQSFARTTENLILHERRLREEEIARRILEADVSRKTRELEEARALQLSMLPRDVPQLDLFDIAVFMETASEVGGDYYDFHVGQDGAMTVVIGDATGHGLKAGMMVAIAKSLVKGGVDGEDFPSFFNRCNRILKQMYLGNLFMGMTLLRIEDSRATISAAGMPPVLLYRAASATIEEVMIKGMPLGAFDHFPYTQVETDLNSGDTLLLLTDGLIELFSPSKAMFGLTRSKGVFVEVAAETSDAIVNRLRLAADEWRGDSPQNDDMTFVVVKIRRR